MAVVLLIGAGLMIRSLAALWSIDPGFDPRNALAFNISSTSGPNPTQDNCAPNIARQFAGWKMCPEWKQFP